MRASTRHSQEIIVNLRVMARQELLRTRLQQASAAASARADYLSEEEVDELIERARSEVRQERSEG